MLTCNDCGRDERDCICSWAGGKHEPTATTIAAVKEFEREMRETVVPRIAQTIRERQRAAQRARSVILYR